MTRFQPIRTPRADDARRACLSALAAVAALALLLPGAASAADRPDTFANLADELLPTVVNISTTQKMDEDNPRKKFEEFFKEFFEERGEEGQRPHPQRRPSSLGSGFVVDPSGYIVTNSHVIADADEITVRFHDDTTKKAEIVGHDDKTDLALLKVETDKKLKAAEWGDSKQTRIGDWVLAIGNPFGLGGTVTAGIVSARSRDINAGPYDDFLQTDAAINRGNSGGPMFNTEGKVIGVNTAIFSPSGGSIGIGFAIPSAIAKNVVSQLRATGDVQRAWLGVRIQNVTKELAEGLRLEEPRGALVASVSEGGPAETAGIRQGDVILRFDGEKVPEMRELPRMVAETRIGKKVDVVIWRKGQKRTLEIKLGKLEDEKVAKFTEGDQGGQEQATPSKTLGALGIDLMSLNDEAREKFDLGKQADGVVITGVDQSGTAAQKGLSEGDVIVEVDQEKVGSPDDVAKRVAAAKREGYRVVTLLVYSGGDHRFVAVEIGNG